LWRQVTRSADFEPYELAHLEAACRLQDRVGELDERVAEDGLMMPGSKGQDVLHPAVAEARAARAEIARLLARIEWPDEAARASQAGRRLRASRRSA
jgi:hypothetical protein